MLSASSILVRAMISFCGFMVASLNHSVNGVTLWVIPILSAFVCMMCHMLEGERNGATISECTREIGDTDAQGTETLFILGVSSAIYECIPCICTSVVSASCMVVRAAFPCCGYPVSALNHSNNGVICWVIPIVSAFVCIMFHALKGNSNEATISGYTRERGARDKQGTETLSGLGVFSAIYGFIPCLFSSVVSTRSILVSATMPFL